VLLVSDKSDTPAALKSLSQRFAPAGVAFARLQARDPAAAAELLAPLGGGLERVPTLMLLGADGTRTVYEGGWGGLASARLLGGFCSRSRSGA
jgi:hypothetical protein